MSAIIKVIICFKKLIAINSKYLNAAEYLLRSWQVISPEILHILRNPEIFYHKQ